MKLRSSVFDESKPAGGQPLRLTEGDRVNSLHDQLYRYAEDLQQLIEQNGELESHYESLLESSALLLQSREELSAVVRSSHDIHVDTDCDGRILQVNPAASKLAERESLIDSMLIDWVVSAHHGRYQALIAEVGKHAIATPEQELRMMGHGENDQPLIVAAKVITIRDDGGVRHLHWILRDVTRLREREFDSQISTIALNSASEGVMITDATGQILSVNPAFSAITGYSEAEVIGKDPRILNSGKQDKVFYQKFWEELTVKGSWQGKIYNRKKSGEIYPEWLSVSTAKDLDGSVLTYIAVFSDLSRLLNTESQLAHLAHHDSLTGLANRLLLEDRLNQSLSLARRTGMQFSVLFLDLDRFKQVNDSLGHVVGDAVLQEAAKRLAGAVREIDTVARLGGDEFIILTPELVEPLNIRHFCNKIIEFIARPIWVDGQEIRIGVSLGCASYPYHGSDAISLIKHADTAMYEAKMSGGNAYAVFRPDVHSNSKDMAS